MLGVRPIRGPCKNGGSCLNRAPVCIIGAGLAGLSAAYDIGRHNAPVIVLDAAQDFGGLASSTVLGGVAIERVYHFICRGDDDLLDLAQKLGIGHQVHWQESKTDLFSLTSGDEHPQTDDLKSRRSDLYELRNGTYGYQVPSAILTESSSTAENFPVARPASPVSGAVLREPEWSSDHSSASRSVLKVREHRKRSKTQPEAGIARRLACEDFGSSASIGTGGLCPNGTLGIGARGRFGADLRGTSRVSQPRFILGTAVGSFCATAMDATRRSCDDARCANLWRKRAVRWPTIARGFNGGDGAARGGRADVPGREHCARAHHGGDTRRFACSAANHPFRAGKTKENAQTSGTRALGRFSHVCGARNRAHCGVVGNIS